MQCQRQWHGAIHRERAAGEVQAVHADGTAADVVLPGNPAVVPAAVRAQELTAFATASVDGDESNIQLVGASLLLASDAGGFITGSEIVVDGGFAAMSI